MTIHRETRADGTWVEEYTGSDLDDLIDAPPAARCSQCWRATWEPDDIGRVCSMPQPDNTVCKGVFCAS